MNSPSCKYHPNEYASWYCPNCEVHSCINCVTDPRGDLFPSCTLCRKTLTSLSLSPLQSRINLGQLINPILQVKSLLFIFASALIMAIVSTSGLPFWIEALLLASVLIPVIGLNFSIMEKVANNEPSSMLVKSLFSSENRSVLIRFLAYLGLTAVLLLKLVATSNLTAQLVASLIVFSMPSSLVIIMMEKQFFSSFNPSKVFAIIKIFSLAYIVIFIGWFAATVMLAAPKLFLLQESDLLFTQSWLVYSFSFLLFQLVFRMMGASVFKNHVELNYSVRSSRRSALRTVAANPMIEVDIFVQEGRFEDAVKNLWKLVDENNSSVAYEKLISIYHFQGNKNFYQKVASQYFETLEQTNNHKRAAEYYCQLQSKGIDFTPRSSKQAVAMAHEMKNPQQAPEAIKLLKKFTHRPSADSQWEVVSLCIAQLEFEFNNDRNAALTLIETILKRGVIQEILESADGYKQVIELH